MGLVQEQPTEPQSTLPVQGQEGGPALPVLLLVFVVAPALTLLQQAVHWVERSPPQGPLVRLQVGQLLLLLLLLPLLLLPRLPPLRPADSREQKAIIQRHQTGLTRKAVSFALRKNQIRRFQKKRYAGYYQHLSNRYFHFEIRIMNPTASFRHRMPPYMHPFAVDHLQISGTRMMNASLMTFHIAHE